jgi:predicted TIM-barrel fold metal-dependent hydrolase
MLSGPLSRRSFLSAATASAAALKLPAAPSSDPNVIDAHSHLHHHSIPSWSDDDRKLIDAAEKLGIDQMWCSTLPPERPATPESFRQCNQWTADAVRRFPGRIRGYCFVNPGYTRESLDEIERCVVDRNFVGVKLYNDYRADEPVLFPIVELAIRLGVPILQHGGHTSWLEVPQPRISDAGHIGILARRYPEAMLICAHVAGGGDWEWTISALRASPTVFLDTSGSVVDAGVVERAVRLLGADRLLFGCDMSLTASIGRIRGAEITGDDRRKILAGNAVKLSARRGNA